MRAAVLASTTAAAASTAARAIHATVGVCLVLGPPHVHCTRSAAVCAGTGAWWSAGHACECECECIALCAVTGAWDWKTHLQVAAAHSQCEVLRGQLAAARVELVDPLEDALQTVGGRFHAPTIRSRWRGGGGGRRCTGVKWVLLVRRT